MDEVDPVGGARPEVRPSRPLPRFLPPLLLFLFISVVFSFRLEHPELHADEITYLNAVFESQLQGRVFPVQGDGQLFLNKPPLSFWAMRISFELLGPTPFAARLPSVLFAAATATLLFLFGSARFGRRVGLLAALIFAFTPSPLVTHGLRAATPDALEILLVTVGVCGLETWRRCRVGWALAATTVAIAATAWVKSPFAVLVFLVYWLATEWFARRAGQGTPRLLASLGLVVVAWGLAFTAWFAVLAADTSPRAVTKRLFNQQYGRRIEGRLGKSHLQGPSFYLETTVADFGPLLALPLASGVWFLIVRRRNAHVDAPVDAARQLPWATAAPLLASVSASKLPWYAYLGYPGMALLLAASGSALARGPHWRRLLVPVVAGILVLRLPLADAWPESPRYRGLVGHLWQLAQDDATIVFVPAPDLELPRQRDVAYREARFYLRTLLKRPTATRASTCRAVLQNQPRTGTELQIELYRPNDEGVGLWLVDECGGRLVTELCQR
ncbi:MAG: glycosyltransferase family 39 protein [Thermoanaerobaculia bacterium]|nr:glycosyltransferase family 39 protein [Thermoanaerobaculia bacterium]